MTGDTKLKILKLLSFGGIIWVLASLQSLPGFLTLGGLKPDIIIPVIIAVSMFESDFYSAGLAVFGGFLCDVYSSYVFGYYTLMFFTVSIVVVLLVGGYIHNSAGNCAVFTFIASLLIGAVGYFFSIAIWNTENTSAYLFVHIFPRCVYTAILAFPAYFCIKKLSGFWKEKI